MRTRAVLGSIFASIAVLVVGYQAGAATVASNTVTTSQPVTSGTSSGTASSGAASSGTSGSATSSSPTTTTPAGAADGTYQGSVVNTRFGTVQVQVTISAGAITDVTALKLTDADGRSVQISNRAAPVLRDEVLAAQSASVSNVSGATYTTQAYLTSLQAALDQAGF